MEKDEGKCPFCNAANSYSTAVCRSCGEELPWASWVHARAQPSTALGAQRGQFAQRSGHAVTDGIGILPRGALTRWLLIGICVVVLLSSLAWMGTKLQQFSGGSAATTGVTNAVTPTGAIEERFKKANPVIEEDRRQQQEAGP